MSATRQAWQSVQSGTLDGDDPFEDLPKDVLVKIFAAVPFDARREILPRVCKRWAALLAEPSGVWESITWSLATNPALLDLPAGTAWFMRRAAAVRKLEIVTETLDGGIHAFNVFLSTVFGVLGPGLQELQVRQASHWLLPQTFVAFTPLTHLRALTLLGAHPSVEARHLNALRFLTGLQSLQVQFARPLEGGFPRGLLRLTRLTHLWLWGGARGGAVRDAAAAARLPESLSSAWPALELLDVSAIPLRELPASLTQLASLKSLEVGAVGVSALNGLAPALRRVRYLTALVDLAVQPDASAAPQPMQLASLQRLQGLVLNVVHGFHATLEVSAASLPTSLVELTIRPASAEAALLRFEPSPGGLRSLGALSLRGCALNGIPPALAAASQLRRLCLSFTPRAMLDAGDIAVLAAMPQLDTVMLSKVCSDGSDFGAVRSRFRTEFGGLVAPWSMDCLNRLAQLPRSFCAANPGAPPPVVQFEPSFPGARA